MNRIVNSTRQLQTNLWFLTPLQFMICVRIWCDVWCCGIVHFIDRFRGITVSSGVYSRYEKLHKLLDARTLVLPEVTSMPYSILNAMNVPKLIVKEKIEWRRSAQQSIESNNGRREVKSQENTCIELPAIATNSRLCWWIINNGRIYSFAVGPKCTVEWSRKSVIAFNCDELWQNVHTYAKCTRAPYTTIPLNAQIRTDKSDDCSFVGYIQKTFGLMCRILILWFFSFSLNLDAAWECSSTVRGCRNTNSICGLSESEP